MAQAEPSTGKRISELADKMGDSNEDISPEEAEEMLDLIIMRASNLAVARGGLDWDEVADKLELNAEVARLMDEDVDPDELAEK